MGRLTSISCILLAYNEEDVIADSIARVEAAAKEVSDDYEVVVVGYEGARDRTNEIVRSLGEKNPRIRLVIQKKEERGYGRAMLIGIRESKKDWIFQSDADGQYDFSELKKLADLAVSEKAAVVHGYRDPRRDSKERLLMAFAYNKALRAIYRIPVRDVDAAFKLIRGDLARGMKINALTGFAVCELLMRIWKSGGKVVQLRVTHLPRLTGEALSDKGIKNPFGLQLPNFSLVKETLGEMVQMRRELNKIQKLNSGERQ